MASPETWKKLRYFTPYENWGDHEAINDDLLLHLDDFRHFVGVPITILSAVKTGGHAEKSYHYRENGSCAVDIVLPEYKKGAMNLILDALRFGFTGLGYYPHWKYQNRIVGGLHLDMRPLKWEENETLNYTQSRWLGVIQDLGQTSEKQVYVPLTFENLIQFGGIQWNSLPTS